MWDFTKSNLMDIAYSFHQHWDFNVFSLPYNQDRKYGIFPEQDTGENYINYPLQINHPVMRSK